MYFESPNMDFESPKYGFWESKIWYNWYHIIFVFLWFISLSTIPSSPSTLLQMTKVHSFYGWVIFNCQYILKILYHSPVDGHCAGFSSKEQASFNFMATVTCCAKWRLLFTWSGFSSCREWALDHSSFSSCDSQALQCIGSVVWHVDLVAPRHMGF